MSNQIENQSEIGATQAARISEVPHAQPRRRAQERRRLQVRFFHPSFAPKFLALLLKFTALPACRDHCERKGRCGASAPKLVCTDLFALAPWTGISGRLGDRRDGPAQPRVARYRRQAGKTRAGPAGIAEPRMLAGGDRIETHPCEGITDAKSALFAFSLTRSKKIGQGDWFAPGCKRAISRDGV